MLSWCVAAGLGRLWTTDINYGDGHSMAAATSPTTTRTTQNQGTVSGIHGSDKSSHGSSPRQDAVPSESLQSKSLLDDDNSEEHRVDDANVENDGGVDDEEDDEDGEVDIESENSITDVQSTEDLSSMFHHQESRLSSPLPMYNQAQNITESCWSTPKDVTFNVRGPSYLVDKVKIPSGDVSFTCEGVDMWMTDNAERHIARHPSVLGGRLAKTDKDIFLVNFLLPFGNFVSYFSVPPLEQFATPQLADVWTRFIHGDQQYRDARLKLLPVVVDGPWIVRAAVPGNSPALLGKVIPLQYFFTEKANGRSVYEVDVIITASSIAKGILSVVKGHAKALSIAFAFIIEASEEKELPETALASFQVNALHLEDCPLLPDCNLDNFE